VPKVEEHMRAEAIERIMVEAGQLAERSLRRPRRLFTTRAG
jgi:hypothetical protein